jgi:hypothetical protein
MATAGTPLACHWDRKKGVLDYRYRADPEIKAPTEIFVPGLGPEPRIRCGAAGLGAAGLGAAGLGTAGLGATELGAAELGAAELGAAELGAAGTPENPAGTELRPEYFAAEGRLLIHHGNYGGEVVVRVERDLNMTHNLTRFFAV